MTNISENLLILVFAFQRKLPIEKKTKTKLGPRELRVVEGGDAVGGGAEGGDGVTTETQLLQTLLCRSFPRRPS